MDILYYIFVFLLILGSIGAGYWFIREYVDQNDLPSMQFLKPREKRVGVVQATSVDGRRKLVLIRRDDVEHLIMTGGPVDVVVETGITPKHSDDVLTLGEEEQGL